MLHLNMKNKWYEARKLVQFFEDKYNEFIKARGMRLYSQHMVVPLIVLFFGFSIFYPLNLSRENYIICTNSKWTTQQIH